MSRIAILFAAFVIGVLLADYASAQTSGAQQKTNELIAALDKTKYKKKEKKNVSIEIYIEIRNEAVVKNNPADYSGVYDSGDYKIELRASSNGAVEGSGYDAVYDKGFNNSERRSFTLRDARIDGALLTATKVFADGSTTRLEAVFTNRTTRAGKNPNEIEERETEYGLSFIDSHGTWTNRVFLELK